MEEDKNLLSTGDHLQNQDEMEEEDQTRTNSCGTPAAFHGTYVLSFQTLCGGGVEVVCVLVVSAPKKRAIAWSDSGESDVEQQSADRITTLTDSKAVDSDRWVTQIQCTGVRAHKLLLRTLVIGCMIPWKRLPWLCSHVLKCSLIAFCGALTSLPW